MPIKYSQSWGYSLKMDGFLHAHDLPILNQDEMNKFRRSIMRNEIQQ